MKKILSVILVVALLFCVFPTQIFVIHASAANTVEGKLNEILNKYPSNSYFSVNGKACGHGQYNTCSNCRLSNICPDATKVCINAYTCLAFARYAFWYIFGLSPDAQSYTWATVDTINSIAKPGDFITFYNSSGNYYHAAIYLGSSANGFYTYASNYGEANKVLYNREHKRSAYLSEKFKVFHASNYDEVNSSTGTVTISSDHYGQNTVTDTNAIVYGWVDKPSSYAVTKIGVKIRKDGDTYNNGWEKYEKPSRDYVGDSYMIPYYNMNTELNLTLTHATKYFYKFYAIVNGKEYWSDEYSITTTGSHSYGSWTTTTAASCTTEGSAKRTCSCGKIETKTLTALGHNYSSSYTTDTAATCTTAGSKSKHCTRCSAKTSVTSIPATGHSWSSWATTKKPTCTETGEQKRNCSVCKKTETKVVAAKGHNYSDKFTIDKAATCTVSGTKSKHCQNCSTKTSVTSIAPTGHKWSEFETITEPTIDKEGLSVRRCQNDNCNTSESKVLPKLATDGHTHAFGTSAVIKNATCTEEGETQSKCNFCDEIEKHTLSALGHNFSAWSEPDRNGLSTRKCVTCNTVEERIIEQTVSSEDVSSNQTSSSTTASPKAQEDGSEKQNFPYIWIIVAGLAFIVGGGLSALIFIKKK